MANGSIENVVGGSLLASIFNKMGDKLWFQIIIGFWLIMGPILFVANPFLNSYLNKQANEKDNVTRVENHKIAFENSMQAYAVVKKTMNEYRERTNSDYMFLIEYHNGNENVMTGIQFCRFDMTIQVSSPELQYISTDKFKDDIVARYDILLSDELAENKLMFYTENDFEKVDRYLAQQLSSIGAKSYAIMNLKDRDEKVFGSLLCVSLSEDPNAMQKTEIILCARDIERIFNTTNK